MSSHIPSAWYADFFTELPNEFWRRAVPPEATAADVAFITDRLALPPGSRILDVPCGSGRHSLALAEAGHRVTGVDISEEAIGHARRAATTAGLAVTFVLSEMRAIPQGGTFDAAICMGNSFGYLDLAGTGEFVAALAGAVRPGGGLVVDFNAAAESILPGYTGEARTFHTGDITVDATTDYDPVESRLINGYRFTRGAEVVEATALHHVYTSGHLGRLLHDGGFTSVERYGGPDGSPFRIGAGRMLLVARRSPALVNDAGRPC